MRLHARLGLLMVLLVLLPAFPAAWMARELVTRSLNLGLSPGIDAALEAGVRHARDSYVRQRRSFADSLDSWVETIERDAGAIGEMTSVIEKRTTAIENEADAPLSANNVAAAASGPAGDRLPAGWIGLRAPDGSTVTLRGGREPASADSAASEGPPSVLTASCMLADGSALLAKRPIGARWREDAQSIATALQVTRGLRAERAALERGFWLPFLGIYAISLLAALVVASLLTRGIVVPLQRLLEATRAIGAGRWNVRVPVRGRDEIALLSSHFNDMVGRLDAQSRRLVDLEKMAGWREMARALAHEVKNPLTPIQLTVEEMRVRYRGEDPSYASLLDECTRIVVQEVESLRNVVARFREFSRPVEPTFAPVDLNTLVADIGALQRDMKVDLDLAPNIGPVRADDDRLRQVLMNLARNAQTATAGRSQPRLCISTRLAGEKVIISMEDNGPGIPPAERERVFEPYRSGSKGGLGLGLALVKGIVLAHRGTIRIEDGEEGGARFVIELPRDPENDNEQEPRGERP
jgi:nitrogen fixation/metabolism regulation signal transduction histidine kinase